MGEQTEEELAEIRRQQADLDSRGRFAKSLTDDATGRIVAVLKRRLDTYREAPIVADSTARKIRAEELSHLIGLIQGVHWGVPTPPDVELWFATLPNESSDGVMVVPVKALRKLKDRTTRLEGDLMIYREKCKTLAADLKHAKENPKIIHSPSPCSCGNPSARSVHHRKTIPCWTYIGNDKFNFDGKSYTKRV